MMGYAQNTLDETLNLMKILKLEQNLKEKPSQFGIYPMSTHQTLTLLLMLCFACSQKPSMAAFQEALPAPD